MKIGIIGPMQEEVALLKQVITEQHTVEIGNHTYIMGKIHNQEIVLTQSGIGKICAASAALVLILHFKVDAVINTGCAGGIGASLKIGDIVLSTGMAYHDFDLRHFGYKRGQVPSYEQIFKSDPNLLEKANAVAQELINKQELKVAVVPGLVLSGDQFIADKQKCLDMLHDFPSAQVTEMEGAAVGQVCTDFNIPCLIIRSVSDTAQGDGPKLYEEFVQLAADNSAKLLIALMDYISK